MPYYPDVATFELNHKTPDKFNRGIQRYRNTMFIQVEDSMVGKPGVVQRRDNVWAEGQMVIDITAGDYISLIETCVKRLPQVHDLFDEKEWSRIMESYRSTPNGLITKEIEKAFGVTVAIPYGSKLLSKRENFFRAEFPVLSRPIEFVGTGGQDAGAISSGVMIYQYDFVDSNQLTLESLLQARDTMLKYNAPYDIEGMYMGTQYVKIVYPEMTASKNASETINGFEMRGMYKFLGKNEFGGGGAFWAYHFVHPVIKESCVCKRLC